MTKKKQATASARTAGPAKGTGVRNLKHLLANNNEERGQQSHGSSTTSLGTPPSRLKMTSKGSGRSQYGIIAIGVASLAIALGSSFELLLVTHFVLFVSVFGSVIWLVHSEFHVASKKRMKNQSANGNGNTQWQMARLGSQPAPIASQQHYARQNKEIGNALLFTFSEFMLYRTDYYLSNFWIAKPLGLMLGAYLLIVAGGALYFCANGAMSLSESFWASWTFVADPGSHADEATAATRFVSLLITLGGILIFAVLIGVVADGVSDTLDALKQGRARVVEVGHTLILGWSDKVLPALAELAIANESEGGGVVVIMAEKDKTEMEREIREAFPPELLFGTTVVCRTGSSIVLSDLESVAATSAKSVIVVSEPNVNPDDSDAKSLRIVISLLGMGVKSHIVVELCDIDNKELVQLVGTDRVEIIVAHDIIGRLMIQCARQPGLAQILERILGFEGDEFYCQEWPELLQNVPSSEPVVTFDQVCFRFSNAIPIGVKPFDLKKTAAALLKLGPIVYNEQYSHVVKHMNRSKPKPTKHNVVLLTPPGEYEIQPGDQILVLAEDDDSYCPAAGGEYADDRARIARKSIKRVPQSPREHNAEQVLFCGWRRDMDDMIQELDKLVSRGSTLTLFCTVPIKTRERRFMERGLNVSRDLRNLTLQHRVGNPVLRKDLEQLRLAIFGSILVLADESFDGNMQTADSRSLASLLLIRDLLNKQSLADNVRIAPLPGDKSPIERAVFEPSIAENDALGGANPRAVQNMKQRYRAMSEDDALSGMSDIGTRIETGLDQCSQSGDESVAPTVLVTDDYSSNDGSSSSNSAATNGEDAADESRNPSDQLHRRRSVRPAVLAKRPLLPRRRSCAGGDALRAAGGGEQTVIISEILDSRTRALISVTNVSDYVMSNEIVACAMAMVSEDPSNNAIISELLSADGSELHVRSCMEYCNPGDLLCFWDLLARTRAKGEIIIGYKEYGAQESVINPTNKDAVREWHRGDLVVVLGRN